MFPNAHRPSPNVLHLLQSRDHLHGAASTHALPLRMSPHIHNVSFLMHSLFSPPQQHKHHESQFYQSVVLINLLKF